MRMISANFQRSLAQFLRTRFLHSGKLFLFLEDSEELSITFIAASPVKKKYNAFTLFDTFAIQFFLVRVCAQGQLYA